MKFLVTVFIVLRLRKGETALRWGEGDGHVLLTVVRSIFVVTLVLKSIYRKFTSSQNSHDVLGLLVIKHVISPSRIRHRYILSSRGLYLIFTPKIHPVVRVVRVHCARHWFLSLHFLCCQTQEPGRIQTSLIMSWGVLNRTIE